MPTHCSLMIKWKRLITKIGWQNDDIDNKQPKERNFVYGFGNRRTTMYANWGRIWQSHKCLTIDRPITEDTVNKYLRHIVQNLEIIRVILNVHYRRLTHSLHEKIKSGHLEISQKPSWQYTANSSSISQRAWISISISITRKTGTQDYCKKFNRSVKFSDVDIKYTHSDLIQCINWALMTIYRLKTFFY